MALNRQWQRQLLGPPSQTNPWMGYAVTVGTMRTRQRLAATFRFPLRKRPWKPQKMPAE
jgi:hypothetical protein